MKSYRLYKLDNTKPTETIVIVAAALMLTPVALFLGFSFLTGSYRSEEVVSTSMSPTLKPTDKISVNRSAYLISRPQRGDIVQYYPPRAYAKRNVGVDAWLGTITGWKFLPQPLTFVHRIVGVEGDKVEIQLNGKLLVNSAPLRYHSEPAKYGQACVIVPKHHFFVLGDNINNSIDSHAFGFVHEDDIVGKVNSVSATESGGSLMPTDHPHVAE